MYDHFIAVDWAQKNMAIARATRSNEKILAIDVPANLSELKLYLKKLRGRKILVFEETTTSQWLYAELLSFVEDIVVCDPYRNRLLSEGPKTDKIDAIKLVQLLKAGLVKPVFHTADEFIYLRKVVSGYEDLVISGVRLKNQRSALFRAVGKEKCEKELAHPAERFVLSGLDVSIGQYEIEKKRYEEEFSSASRKYQSISNLRSLPGIGEIGATKIAAIVIDPRRFATKAHFLSYCGLVRLDRISGGRSYGSKKPRYCRKLKAVFKIAAMSAIGERSSGPLKEYYEFLIKEKNYAAHNARHAVSRRIAVLAYGIMKSGKKFEPGRLKCNQT
jgi:transposase